jgi:hypothetical protein
LGHTICLQQPPAFLLVAKRFNHLRDRSDPQQHLADLIVPL